MKYHKLRIAWSVAWGVACLLLVLLWARSYWWSDYASYQYSVSDSFHVMTTQGKVVFIHGANSLELNTFDYVQFRSIPNSYNTKKWKGLQIWPVATLFGCMAAGAWLRWRFSIRTLLIATTLVAAGLGLVVYALRT